MDRLVIGLDFDNTLISYDRLMHRTALERGLISADTPQNKKAIRDTIRSLTDGEVKWQEVQSQVYGPRILEAELIDGVMGFLKLCQDNKALVNIVSHKTTFAAQDPNGTNLREAALGWMHHIGLFSSALKAQDVFFASEREEKCRKIAELGCHIFVDDLVEVFTDPAFPTETEKILFNPHNDSCQINGITSYSSWEDIQRSVFGSIVSLSSIVEKLTGSPVLSLDILGGGRNSRVFNAHTKNNKSYVAKQYFVHPGDTRDRLQVEFDSLTFLHANGIHNVARPIKQDKEAEVGLYEFITGKNALESLNDKSDINAVLKLISNLRELSHLPEASSFSNASEACFSVSDITENLSLRIDRFSPEANINGPLKKDLYEFLNRQFMPALKDISEHSIKILVDDRPLALKYRILSPSDFGFHNAIRKKDGSLVFVDFEYFGWDDPAKLICDFILHPAMGLSGAQIHYFLSGALKIFDDIPDLQDRVKAMYPLFGLKWCIIFLNEFLPIDLGRRKFSGTTGYTIETLRQEQLQKTTSLLARIRSEYERFPYLD